MNFYSYVNIFVRFNDLVRTAVSTLSEKLRP